MEKDHTAEFKELHAKIGELVIEKDFLEQAWGRSGIKGGITQHSKALSFLPFLRYFLLCYPEYEERVSFFQDLMKKGLDKNHRRH